MPSAWLPTVLFPGSTVQSPKTGEQFTLRDLDSANRTYVNDVAVSEPVLEHGDEIRVGRSVFVFVVDGRPTPQRSADVELDEVEPCAATQSCLGEKTQLTGNRKRWSTPLHNPSERREA
jgi:pSer/pThr/pTyr-binding forkhead associated (FHA) protein